MTTPLASQARFRCACCACAGEAFPPSLLRFCKWTEHGHFIEMAQRRLATVFSGDVRRSR